MKLHSLVLYKNEPAIVTALGDKIEITLPSNSSKKVREKDIIFLHEGPVKSLHEVQPCRKPDNESITETRELVSESPVSLADFSELIFGEFTPLTAWSAYSFISDSIYFKGSVESIESVSEAEIEEITSRQLEKDNAKKEKEERLIRIREGSTTEADKNYFTEVINLALRNSTSSKLMQELHIEETPEKAHELLLKNNIWTKYYNPYPERFGIQKIEKDLTSNDRQDGSPRIDLTFLTSYAIDDEGSNDPDDAISFDGTYFWVHIADPTCIIETGSEVDIMAERRGANLYLPDKIIPMLPESLTSDFALGLSNTSPSLSFKILIDSDGKPLLEEICQSLVKVQRLTYEQADKMIEENRLSDIYAATELYRKRRIANHSIELELPEVKIRYNSSSNTICISSTKDTTSRRLVANAMIMTGEAVAEFAHKNNIPIPYATQDSKDSVNPSGSLSSMFRARLKLKPVTLSSSPNPHKGLGLDFYTRATSPLRRYCDLLVHQQLKSFLNDDPPMTEETILDKATSAASKAKDIAFVERCSNTHWKLIYMEENNWEGEAVLVDKHNGIGTYIIPELAFEFKLPTSYNIELDSVFRAKYTGCSLPYLRGNFTLS